jgi:hypothetical protein
MRRPLVTVKTLLTQSRECGEIELPEGALITPAAVDWLRSCAVPVRRAEAVESARGNEPTVYVIGDAAKPYMQALLPILERKYPSLEFLRCHGCCEGLLAAVKTMCAGLDESDRRRGVIVVQNGALPSCVANKQTHVRAAILSQPSALFALQRELGINVLIIEEGRISLRQAQATIDAFLTGKTRLDPVIAAALSGAPGAPDAQPAHACGSGC